MPIMTLRTKEGEPLVNVEVSHKDFCFTPDLSMTNKREFNVTYYGPDTIFDHITLKGVKLVMDCPVALRKNDTVHIKPGSFNLKVLYPLKDQS